jgi:hypothetical protein
VFQIAAYAAAKPLEAEPGRWSYSSGTTNIIAYAMRRLSVIQTTWSLLPRPFDRLADQQKKLTADLRGILLHVRDGATGRVSVVVSS